MQVPGMLNFLNRPIFFFKNVYFSGLRSFSLKKKKPQKSSLGVISRVLNP